MKQRSLFRMLIMHKQSLSYFIGVFFDKAIHAFAYNIVMAIVVRDLFNASFEGRSDLFLRGLIFAVLSLGIALFIQPIFMNLAKKSQKQRMHDLRIDVFSHMIKCKIPYFEQSNTGDIMNRLNGDMKIIEELYEQHIPRITFMILLGFGSLAMMFVYSIPMTLLALFFELLSVTSQAILAKKVRKKSNLVQECKSNVQTQFINALAAWKTTKLYHLEDIMNETFKQENQVLASSEKKHAKLLVNISVIDQAIYTAKTISLIGLGVFMIINGRSDIGTLFAIINLMNNLGLIAKLGDPIGKMQSSLSGASRVQHIFKQDVELEKSNSPYLHNTSPIFETKSLTFGYHDSPILKDVTMKMDKGEKLALKGRSGSGKSTIAKLLLGFYSVPSGMLYFEGNDINDISLHDIRSRIGYVSQEPMIFSGTVKENILLSNEHATEEELISVAKKAHAHDFIMNLPNGYHTVISENGNNLSIGQKQRICIARALLKKSPLLLLDEPTSALDEYASKQIEKVLKEIDKNEQSILLITHHLYDKHCVEQTKNLC